MQARYYDPVIGRFLSNDPVGFAQGGVDYFNRYSYTANNPVNFWDPDGRQISGRGPDEEMLLEQTAADPASTMLDTHGAASSENIRIELRLGGEGTRGQPVNGGLTEIVNIADGSQTVVVTIDPSDTVEVDGINTETGENTSRILTLEETVEHELDNQGHAMDFVEGGIGKVIENRTSNRAVDGGNTFRERKNIPFQRANHGGRLVESK